jgi:hypothetical protein
MKEAWYYLNEFGVKIGTLGALTMRLNLMIETFRVLIMRLNLMIEAPALREKPREAQGEGFGRAC